MRRCKIVIALVLAACIGITVAYIASMTSLLPGIEFRYVTNGRTGEPVGLLGSLIAYGFVWFIGSHLPSLHLPIEPLLMPAARSSAAIEYFCSFALR